MKYIRHIITGSLVVFVSTVLGVTIWLSMKCCDRHAHYVPPPYDSTRIRV